jgi:hypothetical protein
MKPSTFFRNFFLVVAALSATAFPITAQSADDAPDGSYDSAYAQPPVEEENAQPVGDVDATSEGEALGGRVSYAHVTSAEGTGSVLSDANGRTEMQINLPVAESDQLVTRAGARAEIELADGNRVQIGGESQVRFDALAGEQGSRARESALTLMEGSIAVEAGTFSGNRAFRVDTPDASVYVTSGGQARINLDPRRGTTVIARRGTFDVQTRAGSIPVQEGQYLLVHGDEQPELARGTFSRDRFDAWVAQRSQTILQAHSSAAARYLDDDAYDEDVAALDQYGSWDYSPTYSTNVWRPDVSSDWSPYSDGYWYYTPAGATWVDNAPWGWFPHHFGNWLFDAAFGSWCWSPASVYSPGWVYWGYSGGYTGWCPIGYYSYFAPWGSYWGSGWGSGLYFSVNGIFDRGRVDCGRGWNFVGNDAVGSHFGRGSVLPGTRVAARLGTQIAVTSNPLRPSLVSGRGSAPAAMRAFARTAPATIASRTSPGRSAALAPFMARQRTLPAQTVNALRQSQVARVNPASRSIQGPGASALPGVASRGGAQTRGFSSGLSGGAFASPGSARSESWRSSGRSVAPASPRSSSAPFPSSASPRSGASAPTFRQRSAAGPDESWRGRPASPRSLPETAPRSGRFSQAPAESWRTRSSVPPAQRVIEGIDRGRALPPSRGGSIPERRSFDSAPPPRFERQAPPRFERQAPPRFERQAPPPRLESRPAPPAYERRAQPSPRFERQAPPPPSRFESRPSPSPRFESRPAPPSRGEARPAPPPTRSAPRQEYSRRTDRSHR